MCTTRCGTDATVLVGASEAMQLQNDVEVIVTDEVADEPP